MQSSTLSFESYITEPETEKNLKRFDYDKSRTLSEIVNELISMLQGRIQKQPLEEKDIVGYTHVSLQEQYEEFESVSFCTTGSLQTDKGEINLELDFSMSRNFVIENRIDIYTPFDPLVINLEGDLPQLEQTRFSFDLDNDGKKENIPELSAGNGFLVYDKNNDGIINNGSELFGTQGEDGFCDLANYDDDHNNWIDENDAIFEKLQIWLKDEQSDTRELIALGDADVGAIFLGNTQTQYSYKTQQNETLGELKRSGIFLQESGEIGVVAQIDFDINKTEEPLATLLQA